MNNIRQINSLTAIKNTEHKYIQASSEFTKYFGFNKSQDIIGLDDFDIFTPLVDEQALSLSDLVGGFFDGDLKGFTGQSIFLLECVPYNGQINYIMTHKTPYIEDNKVCGVNIHLVRLGSLPNKLLRNFLCAKDMIISEYTAKLMQLNDIVPHYQYKISARELQCIQGLCKGKTAKQIALEQDLSQRTIEAYIEKIKHKLGVHKITEIVAKAIQEQLYL